jgi:hypothetical protein
VSLRVARKALAAATMPGVAFCDVLAVALAPAAVVASAVTSIAGVVLAAVASAPVVAAVVAAGTLVARAVGCCAAGTVVAVALGDPHALRSAAPADIPVRANISFKNARRVVTWPRWFAADCPMSTPLFRVLFN